MAAEGYFRIALGVEYKGTRYRGWQRQASGVLSVQQMPLAEFVSELGRYRPGLLRCAPEVAGLKVSGTYQLADTGQILQLLTRSLPVRVEYRTRYWVSIGAA